jgi:hypothetical protein
MNEFVMEPPKTFEFNKMKRKMKEVKKNLSKVEMDTFPLIEE